ncbi:MAG: hypothetical protein JWO06_2805, partial [Bacteroidota bacterium]|nr:hypothetical protein [Bacteroidota bacterium]
SAFEYRVSKNGTISAQGYIYAGIKAPVIEYRGKLVMIVDSLLNDSLSVEIERLMKDISGDGWAVQRLDVSTADNDMALKNLIRNIYLADSVNVKAVLLIGHIAVPYSGDINPDGHPNHLGAWPADIFYANMHLSFTDATVNDTLAYRPENQNRPGDGKWDQSWTYGSKNELQVSRIDLSNMPSFVRSERQLLKTYLDKDHNYRMKNITTIARGLIDDNFGAFGGEAFAINGWKNFAPILGDSNIFSLDYVTTLDTANFQWSYGCGGGNFNGASGIGSSSDFVTHHVKSIFSMLFGSYFGDWDNSDNFLRSPLCALEPALTVCWAGRPHWELHHMALGENIGYGARLTQNETGALYATNYGGAFVHVALMGDLTLRQHIISPSNIVALSDTNENVSVTWAASTDSVLGYYVYRGITEFGKYDRVSNNIVAANSFVDVGSGPGLKFYMVKAVKLENTPSGTYYNLSEGIADSITVRDTVSLATSVSGFASAKMSLELSPDPATDILMLNVSEAPADFSVEIFDETGRKAAPVVTGTGNQMMSLNISSLAPGFYLCRITGCGQSIMKKFEVAR